MSVEIAENPNLPVVSLPSTPLPYKAEVYQKFIEFCGMPDPDKAALFEIEQDSKGRYVRIPGILDFAKKYGIHRDTCTDWKKRADFAPAVMNARIQWGANLTPNVMAALYRRCVTYGRGEDVETWLAIMEGWDRKKGNPLVQIDNFTINDIRVLVAALPADQQAKFHDTISSIIIEAQRNGISIDS